MGAQNTRQEAEGSGQGKRGHGTGWGLQMCDCRLEVWTKTEGRKQKAATGLQIEGRVKLGELQCVKGLRSPSGLLRGI